MNYSTMYLGIMLLMIGMASFNVLFISIDLISWIIRITGAVRTSKADLGYKYIWCNNALGISSNREYYAYKFLFATIVFTAGIFVINIFNLLNVLTSIIAIYLAVLAYKIPDIVLYIAKKQREKAIAAEIPAVINKLAQAPEGSDFEEVIKSAIQETRGPLSKELSRFLAAQMYSPDFEENIKDFKKRLNIPLAENVEMAIRNKYYTGVYNNVYTGSNLLLRNKISAQKRGSVMTVITNLAVHILTVVIGFILFVIPVI